MFSESRTYPEGWNTDDGRDSTLEYRLSIDNAEVIDSGIYTCMTPARHTHSREYIFSSCSNQTLIESNKNFLSVNVEVKAVHCNEITPRRGLALSTTQTQMGTKVQFSCNNGNALIGTPEITCLASGNWSSPLPVCESMQMSSFNKQFTLLWSLCRRWMRRSFNSTIC